MFHFYLIIISLHFEKIFTMFRLKRKNYKMDIDGVGEITVKEFATAKGMRRIVHRDTSVTVTHRPGIAKNKVECFVRQHSSWIENAKKRCARRAENSPVPQSNHAVDPEEVARLRNAAKNYLPERVRLVAERFGLKYNVLKINRARTRWGSCTSRKNINLSCFVMRLPLHLIDFVILHELCHTVHMNHGTQFHALLNRFCGFREKDYNRQLRTFRIN